MGCKQYVRTKVYQQIYLDKHLAALATMFTCKAHLTSSNTPKEKKIGNGKFGIGKLCKHLGSPATMFGEQAGLVLPQSDSDLHDGLIEQPYSSTFFAI